MLSQQKVFNWPNNLVNFMKFKTFVHEGTDSSDKFKNLKNIFLVIGLFSIASTCHYLFCVQSHANQNALSTD